MTPSPEKKSRANQREQILHLLQSAKGREVGLPEILACRISQYGSRLHELRGAGYVIRNRKQWIDGQIHSWFRLESSPDEKTGESLRGNTRQINRDDPREQLGPTGLFPEFGVLVEEMRYPD